jgi:hypothetical protein
MKEFAAGERCRRAVLDGYIDGQFDRQGCEEEEQRCDVCYPQFVNVIVSIPFYRIPDSVSGCTRIASIPFNQSHFNANE